ncbi:phage shock protein C (PspC) family protein [Roseivirga ehrenbergii]|uniref:PspC family transcriptional regulator n=3 Tax=Roseivirga TaxID=290180 RepID=A0A0L8ALI6_9BACT|nr:MULTISPECIES: PspC domain-containing protein [Roseivirga]KOF03106.1 PspC family transcriptional regulator [Roseivirga seohaensis subsp. aquiponti]KYG71640.1 PspC family transcriptional regulator [Roseivirga ehrenbergii]KYG80072.1 PspC family transcriptional regulator [Roseivirga seohaensis]TCL07671.1 phage shock protein C (PspC) family protein [Roseivirga ehrenbergii]|tara:strand:+ start:74 stop:292 length:219 start_codon:yes stop_codon:yes gene_type:complete
MERIQRFFESQAYGVCTKLGEKLNLSASSIRLFFIYASFITFGSPLLIYLGLAYVINFRKHLRRRQNPVWYN